MCNFSQGFYERGREEGIEIGIKIGREKERKQSQIESLKAVMESLNVNFTKAADILRIPGAEREEYYVRLHDKTNPADKNG